MSEDKLPCGHEFVTILERRDNHRLIRCTECLKLWVQTVGTGELIPVESVFKLSELAQEDL